MNSHVLLKSQVKINKVFELKIENIFLPFSFNMCFDAQKNSLDETVLLGAHNVCFNLRNKKNKFSLCA